MSASRQFLFYKHFPKKVCSSSHCIDYARIRKTQLKSASKNPIPDKPMGKVETILSSLSLAAIYSFE